MIDPSGRISRLSAEKRALLEQKSAALRARKITRRSVDAPLPLSFEQERLWFLQQLHPPSAVYNVPLVLRLRGRLNREAVQRAMSAIVARHEALRTVFVSTGEGPRQVVAEPRPVELPVVDLRGRPQLDDALESVLAQDAARPFDLRRDLLLRTLLVQTDDDDHALLVTLHHIGADGWSIGIWLREFAQSYEAFAAGQVPRLPELPIQYGDFALWQRERGSGTAFAEAISYWKQHLGGSLPVLDLPTDRPRPAEQSYAGARQPVEIPEPMVHALRELSRQEGATLFMTLLAAFTVLLRRYTGQECVLVGFPFGNRARVETEGLIGFFVNTLVFRGDLSANPSFRELLERTRRTTQGAYSHAEIPFEKLVQELRPERDASRSPIFQTMFALHAVSHAPQQLAGLEWSWREVSTGTSKFDLHLTLEESASGIAGYFEYSTDLFDAALIRRMAGHFRNLLEGILADPARQISVLPLISEAERRELLSGWNGGRVVYPRTRCVHQWFEEQAARTPDNVAVVCQSERLTYRELNARANQLAHYLRRRGVGPEMLVALYTERSLEMVVALLGILKAGGAYLPIDTAYPRERIAFLLDDAQARVLLTQEGLRASLPESAAEVVCLDTGWDAIARESTDNPVGGAGPDSLAYVIYTSGSTGQPKGVEIPQKALVNLLCSMRDWLELDQRDRLLAVTTIAFDTAGADIWLPLLVGARTVICARSEMADGYALRDLMERHEITFLQATPATWRLLFDTGWGGKRDLQAVCTGEAMPPDLPARLAPAVRRAWNLYGPTETTVWSTGYQVNGSENPIPIGRPLPNTQCYILDGQRQPVPVGVAGELYIGGDGLARGYRKRPELTAERFVGDPFVGGGARMYRTGDWARCRADGNIEYLGRLDQQVKIRGFRVELGEIEAALSQHPGVKECVVIAREDRPGDKRLAAYFVAQKGERPSPSTLKAFLAGSIPLYAVPGQFVLLDALPLTSNGKVNRLALPSPSPMSSSAEDGSAAPRDEFERFLCQAWADVLGLECVGIFDDFFDLGGHSLLAVQLVLRIQKIIPGEEFPLSALLHASTVERFAAWLRTRRRGEWQFLVRMLPGSPERTPFFCVPGSGGNILFLRPLAMALPVDLPFYSFQAKGLDGSEPFGSVEEAARCYVEELRKVQPHGPYYLGGASYGGLVAFEMARILEGQSESVASLFLIDTYNFAFGGFLPLHELIFRNMRYYLRRAAVVVRRLPSIRPGEWPAFFAKRFAILRKHVGQVVRVAAGQRGTQFPVDRTTVTIAAGTKLGEVLTRVNRAARVATSTFVPKPYGGSVVLFRASERYNEPYEDEYLGWGPVVHGGIEAVEIPGGHDSIFEDRDVKVFAERLNAKLLEASAKLQR